MAASSSGARQLRCAAFLASLVVTACADTAPGRDATVTGPGPTAIPPLIGDLNDAQLPDACGAKALQAYIGQPLQRLPAVPPGVSRRLVCSTCAYTEDYSPRRQTVFFDRKSKMVLAVRCT
jgi:hypothetical protein